MAADAMVGGDSNLEKIISAEITGIVNKMSPSSVNIERNPFYNEDSSDEDEWGEDAEVEVEIKEKDNSTVKRLSRYSLGYLDFTDHEEGRLEDSLWYQLMVKPYLITEKRPQPTPLPASVRYVQDPTSGDDEEEFDKLSEWAWPSDPARRYAAQSTTGPTSHPAQTV